MKKFLVSIGIIVFCITTSFAQNYKTHKVKVGETIESISKAYMVTPYDIYALNPDVKSDLQLNSIIIIPKSKIAKIPTEVQEQALSGYKKHKVKRKETLYSIAKKYNITVEDIKKHNKRLYSENLRKGDRIQIPQFKTIVVTNTLENTIKKYAVQPKEGKWRVAYKFGITVDELEQLNPTLGDSLQLGQELNVPNIADNEIKSVDEEYNYYSVLPKEGFYRLKLKLGLTQEQLEDLNPELVNNGLKSGMVLKVPKDIDSALTISSIEQTSLSSNLKNFSTKRLAIMMPFKLHRIDLDSIREAKEILEKDTYMSISVDFHTGVLMALDSAKQLGISSNLDVFDTQARISEVSKILSDNDFSNYDAVIGPIKTDNFDRTATVLKSDNVPVFAAMTTPLKMYSNVYQTIPTDEFLRKTLVNYIKTDSTDKNIIIVSDEANKLVSNALKQDFPSAKQIFSRKTKKGVEGNFILISDLETKILPGLNIVFIETANEGFVSNVTSMLNALNGVNIETNTKHEIVLMTTNKNKAFEGSNVSNVDLSNLKLHYASVNRAYDSERKNNFVNRYNAQYGSDPNRYAVRGFDLMLDILLRLASEEDLRDATDNSIETEYVENKFRYNKKLFSGYYNEAAYIIKFDDLKLIEVKQ